MELGEQIESKQIFILELDVDGEMLRNVSLFYVARGNHITLDNRVLGHMYMRRPSWNGGAFVGGGYYFTFVHSSFLRTSMIAPGQFPGCVQSQWNDKSRIWQNSHYRNQRGPWRRHLADSSSNLCNRAKVPVCCLKYERVTHSSGTFNPLILNGVKQVYSFPRQRWGLGDRTTVQFYQLRRCSGRPWLGLLPFLEHTASYRPLGLSPVQLLGVLLHFPFGANVHTCLFGMHPGIRAALEL